MLEDKRLLGKHLKKSQKEINHLKAEKDQLYKERECEIKARLAAEKLASTHKGTKISEQLASPVPEPMKPTSLVGQNNQNRPVFLGGTI